MSTNGYRVSKLYVKDFLGIEQVDLTIPPGGIVAKGRCGSGKTSLLRAVQACLVGRGVDESAIRLGADRAEVIVDVGELVAKRVITRKGPTLTVTNKEGGFRATKPQTLLNELFSGSAVDPLDLYLADKKDRRAKILAALPITVTLEELRAWAPVVDGFDVSGHGLEVIERARKKFYDDRTAANAQAKSTAGDLERARAAAELIPDMPAKPYGEALAAFDVAKADAARVAAKEEQAARQREKSASARSTVERLRREAAEARSHAEERQVQPEHLALADDAEEAAAARVVAARRELEVAEAARRQAQTERGRLVQANIDAQRFVVDAERAERQAADLEAVITSTIDAPAPGEREAAAARVSEAEAELAKSSRAKARADAVAEVARKESAAATAKAEADRLDAIVKKLSDDAPRALLSRSGGVPGLTIEDDDVRLDGKSLDALCGAERMRFCVAVAKRTNKAPFLVCDGLERLDPETLDAFVRDVVADGTQLIGSRVTSGEIAYEAIEAADAEPEAAE